MVAHPDSIPFRQPVDTEQYPDYLTLIDHPMDFSSIRGHLDADAYTTPKDFFKDVQLVFSNSKAFNTNKRSQIYLMTLRLRSLFEEKRDALLKKWRRKQRRRGNGSRFAPRREPSNDAPPTPSASSSNVHSRVLKLKLNAQRSFANTSPTKTQAGLSSVETRNGFSRTVAEGTRPRSERIGNAIMLRRWS